MGRPWQNEERLRESYQKHHSMNKVADELHCSARTVRIWMDKFEIEQVSDSTPEHLRDEEHVREIYEKHNSLSRAADELGICRATLWKHMKKLGIERDDGRNPPDQPWTDKQDLEQLYWEDEMSASEVGNVLGCSRGTITTWLKKHELGVRDKKEAIRLRHK